MAQTASEPVRTFSVVFPGWPGLDESVYARQVAERFDTAHTEIAVEADVAAEWPRLVAHLDEPFADPATLPTWLMARETRRHVTVVLTGEGADELFAGYGWYGWSPPWPLPVALRKSLRRLAQTLFAGRRGRHTVTAAWLLTSPPSTSKASSPASPRPRSGLVSTNRTGWSTWMDSLLRPI